MPTLLVRNATVIATMDDERREIRHGGLFARDGWIEQIGQAHDLPSQADEVVDLSGHVVLPGFVNAHHHLFQTWDRACPGCQRESISGWLRTLYPRWAKLTPEDVSLAAQIGLAELVLSGCTTVADHQYLWPNGTKAADQLALARTFGIRFHLGYGFQNLGEGSGGFAPKSLLLDQDDALATCDELIQRHHDDQTGALTRIFVAPSSLRTVSPGFIAAAAALARKHRVGFHMHLSETFPEIDFCQATFGTSPVQAVADLGGLGPSSWFAHAVHFNADDVATLAAQGGGVCHCPTSNLRLGSGIAPIVGYLDAGIPVGLGVDGAASNDSSNMLAEIRLANLLARVAPGRHEPFLDPRRALELATRGGARLLGRDDIGSLQIGKAADFVAIDLDRLPLLGGGEDPVAAIVLCAVTGVDRSWVHGRPVVEHGHIHGIDLDQLAVRARERAARLQ